MNEATTWQLLCSRWWNSVIIAARTGIPLVSVRPVAAALSWAAPSQMKKAKKTSMNSPCTRP